MKPGDWMCFYATGVGIVGQARIASAPKYEAPGAVATGKYPWVVKLDNILMYPDSPVSVDEPTRKLLEAFHMKDTDAYWGWFVKNIHLVSMHDFMLLTRQRSLEPTQT